MSTNEFGVKSYEYAIGCIKASSHPALSKEQLKRIEEADIEEAKKLLDEFGYAKDIQFNTVFDRIEGEYNYTKAFVMDIAPDREALELLFFEEDALNLKLIIKGEIAKINVDKKLDKNSTVPIEILKASVHAGDFSLLGEEAEKILTGIEKEEDPLIISALCDRAMYARALASAKKKDRAVYDMLCKFGKAKNALIKGRVKEMSLGISLDRILLDTPLKDDKEDARSIDDIEDDSNKIIENAMYDLRCAEGFAPIAEFFFAKKSEAAKLRRAFTNMTRKGL